MAVTKISLKETGQCKESSESLSELTCWVPFINVCSLHTIGVLDATPWYALFSIVILPINSVVNPLLYDATIKNYCKYALTRVQHRIVHLRLRASLVLNGAEDTFIAQNTFINHTTRRHRYCNTATKSVFLPNGEEDATHQVEASRPNNTPNNEIIELKAVPKRRIVYVEEGEQPCCSRDPVE